MLRTPTQTVWYQRGHESHLTQFARPYRLRLEPWRRRLYVVASDHPSCRRAFVCFVSAGLGLQRRTTRRQTTLGRSTWMSAGEFDWSRAYSPAVSIWADSSSSPLAGEWRKWGFCSETYRGHCGMCRPRPPSIYKQLAAYFKVLKALRVSTTTSNAVVTFIFILLK